MHDSIIFDLDGTLWSACSSVAKGWTAGAAKSGINQEVTKKDIQGICGLPYLDCVRTIFPGLDEQTFQKLVPNLAEHEQASVAEHGGELYPGVMEELKELKKNFKLAVVSNCEPWYLELFLNQFDCHDLFIDWECFGNTQRPKGENIKSVIERNSLKSAVYVGDTLGDQQAAEFAGVPFVFAEYGFGEAKSEIVIGEFKDLRKLPSFSKSL